jgi:hypothetical protein
MEDKRWRVNCETSTLSEQHLCILKQSFLADGFIVIYILIS